MSDFKAKQKAELEPSPISRGEAERTGTWGRVDGVIQEANVRRRRKQLIPAARRVPPGDAAAAPRSLLSPWAILLKSLGITHSHWRHPGIVSMVGRRAGFRVFEPETGFDLRSC